MFMMLTAWFDTSGTGRLMLVLLLAFKAQSKWQLMLMMRTVWSAALVLLAFLASCQAQESLQLMLMRDGAADACFAPGLQGAIEMAADAHDAHGLV